MDYKDMLGPDGTENNMGGTEQFFFLVSHSDVKDWKKPVPDEDAPQDDYVIKVPHVLLLGKKMIKVYATMDTTELEIAIQGEADGHSFKPTFKAFYPGSKAETITFMNKIKNDKFLILVPLADGTIIQLGTEKFCAYAKPTFKSDKTSGRGKGTEIEFTSMQPDIYIYAAALPVAATA